ncbi:hypothetical protein BC567DRAFT_238003 [Phyllosticta citribraziliensis]
MQATRRSFIHTACTRCRHRKFRCKGDKGITCNGPSSACDNCKEAGLSENCHYVSHLHSQPRRLVEDQNEAFRLVEWALGFIEAMYGRDTFDGNLLVRKCWAAIDSAHQATVPEPQIHAIIQVLRGRSRLEALSRVCGMRGLG